MRLPSALGDTLSWEVPRFPTILSDLAASRGSHVPFPLGFGYLLEWLTDLRVPVYQFAEGHEGRR